MLCLHLFTSGHIIETFMGCLQNYAHAFSTCVISRVYLSFTYSLMYSILRFIQSRQIVFEKTRSLHSKQCFNLFLMMLKKYTDTGTEERLLHYLKFLFIGNSIVTYNTIFAQTLGVSRTLWVP